MRDFDRRLADLEAYAEDLELPEPVGVFHCSAPKVTAEHRKAAKKRYPGRDVIFCTLVDASVPHDPEPTA